MNNRIPSLSLAKLENIYNPKALYIIKRCQDVGLVQEKRPAGADLKHVRKAQSPKQMVHSKKQKTIIISLGGKYKGDAQTTNSSRK